MCLFENCSISNDIDCDVNCPKEVRELCNSFRSDIASSILDVVSEAVTLVDKIHLEKQNA